MNRYFNLNSRKQSSILSWLRLVRLPNLFTAIGDSLAGLCIASCVTGIGFSPWMLVLLPLCGVLLYAAGIIMNDWHDIPDDRRHNPDRPLAAGLIAPSFALLVAIVMALGALTLAALLGRMTFLVAIVLVLAILAYNNILKRYPKQGAICMGVCRMLNFLLGVAAVKVTADIAIPAVTLLSYIAYVTYLADSENRKVQIPDKNVFYPAIIFGIGWLVSAITVLRVHFCGSFFASLICAILGAGLAAFAGMRVYNKSIRSNEAHAFIGCLISALIPMQASAIAMAFPAHGILVIVVAVLLWAMTVALGKVFRQS